MKITIIGGGNIGTLMAGELAFRGHEITMFTSRPDKWTLKIEVLDQNDNVLMYGKLAKVTSNLQEAVNEAEIIFVTLPAQMFLDLGKKLANYVCAGQLVGVIPGSGGAEFAFHDLLVQGVVLFGLQRVHSIARLEEYGKSVHMLGRKKQLELGTIPATDASIIAPVVGSLFDMPCTALTNYLCVTLTPSNPILHTTRLYTIFKDYHEGVVYSRNILFYEEWTDETSEILIACDSELQMLCNKIPLELTAVQSLCEYYESYTVYEMTRKIRGISAFKGLEAPMTKKDNGWVPDFDSRYFTTDFPYGLKIIKDLATIYNVQTPIITMLWNWYMSLNPKKEEKANINLEKISCHDIENMYN